MLFCSFFWGIYCVLLLWTDALHWLIYYCIVLCVWWPSIEGTDSRKVVVEHFWGMGELMENNFNKCVHLITTVTNLHTRVTVSLWDIPVVQNPAITWRQFLIQSWNVVGKITKHTPVFPCQSLNISFQIIDLCFVIFNDTNKINVDHCHVCVYPSLQFLSHLLYYFSKEEVGNESPGSHWHRQMFTPSAKK